MGFILMLMSSTILFSQKITSEAIARLTLNDQAIVNTYLKQSKNLKVSGIVLATVGGSLLITGFALYVKELNNDVWGDGKEPGDIGGPLVLIGTAASLGSIPCFVVSNVRKKQARAIVFTEKGVSMTPQILVPNSRHVGFKLLIPIGK